VLSLFYSLIVFLKCRKIMKTKWLNVISPCILLILICVIAALKSFFKKYETNEYNSLILFIYIPAILFLILADIIVKSFFKERILYVWIIELLLLFLFVYLFGFNLLRSL